jgi:deoxyhypusine synthase
MRRLEKAMVEVWTRAEAEGQRYFPHEFMYQVLKNGSLEEFYQIDLKDSWMQRRRKLCCWIQDSISRFAR